MRTGWIDEPPDDGAPAMPLTGMLLARGERQTSALEIALARTRGDEARATRRAAASVPDPDERCANMIAAGLMPGQVSELAQRHAAAVAAAQGERDKISRNARLQARIARDHAAGAITAFDIANMPDRDEGDVATAERLERRAESLRVQLAGAQAMMISPQQQRAPDPLEAAAQRAHAAFAEVTRAKMAELQAGRAARRPFASASASRGGVAVRTEVTCAECIKVGATPEQSFLIHQDPDAPIEEELVDVSEEALAAYARETGIPYPPAQDGAQRRERDDYGVISR